MIVIKLGGGQGIQDEHLVQELATLEQPWILVHGGNHQLDELSRQTGHEPQHVTSPNGLTSRVTDAETVRLIQMAYRGRRNNELVRQLQNEGVNAVGLSGLDGRILQAQRKTAIKAVVDGRTVILRDGHTGRITHVDPNLPNLLLSSGYRPVITIPAHASDGTAVNVDGDRAAAQLAVATGAQALVILSDVPGLLQDPDDADSLVPTLDQAGLVENPHAQGRMRTKLLAAQEALDGGVGRVVLATANQKRPLARALEGHGTVIR